MSQRDTEQDDWQEPLKDFSDQLEDLRQKRAAMSGSGREETRLVIKADYRKYFTKIRKFEPFPMTLNYENVIDFVSWRARESAERIAQLEAWKESAITNMPDLQKIGELLGVRLGDSISDKIIPALKELQAENGRLRGVLQRYGHHDGLRETKFCAVVHSRPCDCGFESALAGSADRRERGAPEMIRLLESHGWLNLKSDQDRADIERLLSSDSGTVGEHELSREFMEQARSGRLGYEFVAIPDEHSAAICNCCQKPTTERYIVVGFNICRTCMGPIVRPYPEFEDWWKTHANKTFRLTREDGLKVWIAAFETGRTSAAPRAEAGVEGASAQFTAVCSHGFPLSQSCDWCACAAAPQPETEK